MANPQTAARRPEAVPGDALHYAIENLALPVCLCDPRDRIVLVNRAWRELNPVLAEAAKIGVTYEEFLRALVAGGGAPDAAGSEEAWIARRLELRRTPRQPLELERKEGWFLVHDAHLPDGSILTYLVDITARKRAEEAIARSEARFRGLTALSSDWYWEQDEQFRFTFISSEVREKTGIDMQTHLGKTRWDMPALNMSQEDWARHRAALGRHEPFHDLKMRRPDNAGRQHWVSVSGEPVFDGEGRFRGYRGVGRDITREVLAQEEVRLAKERLEQALEASKAASWEADLGTDEVELSDGWATFLGLPRAPTCTTLQALSRFVHHEDLPLLREAFVETIKGRRPEYLGEHRFKTPSGEWKWLLSRGRVTRRDANGRAVRMSGINLDITERKRADAALREQSERLQLGQAAARVIIMDWDIPSDRLVGSGPPEWLRGPLPASGEYPLFKDQVHPEDRERFLAARDRAMASLQGGSHEYRVVRTDGEVIWAQSREKVIADASGRAVRVLAAVLDITERKRSEVALAASEARAQDFARASGEWFWETDAGHRFTWFSESVAETAGIPAGWHLGKRRDELAAESSDFTAEPWKSHLEALRRHEAFRDFRYLRQGPQGAQWLSVSGVPLFGKGGRFLGYRGVGSDVTRLVEMERRAREADVRLRHTLENFDEFVCLTDAQDRVVFANRRYRQDAGDCAEYVQPGRHYGDFLRARAARGHYLDAVGREEQWVQDRLAQRRKGGGPREQHRHDGVVMLVFDQCFADGSVMTYGLDVTKRLRMEAELRRLNQELENRVAERTGTLEGALRDLEAFSYSVSHDLRSSLGVISNFAHLIRLDEAERLSGEGRRHLGIVEQNAQKLGRLVDDLLALAKVGGGAMRDEPLDLHEIASSEARELAGAYPRTELRIGPLPAARGDPTLVRQIFANLLGNAFKYSSLTAAPCVEVGWSEPERAWYVRDNGVGFDPSRTDKLFGAFERLHADSQFEGQGIGLAVVKRAIERHGGSVWAQGRPGEGATVYFRLQPAA